MKSQAFRPRSRGFDSIQHLRAVAALSVVVYHVGVSLSRFHDVSWWPQRLSAGVDVFFVVSGFIMWTSTRRQTMSPLKFLANRVRRIVPLYWAVTGFVLAVLLIAPGVMDAAAFDPWHTISSFLFIASEYPGKGREIAPLLVVGWTLNYEFYFYAIFAVALALPARMQFGFLTSVLLAVVFIGIWVEDPKTIAGFYTAPIVLEFLFGAGIGWALERWNEKGQGAVSPRAVRISVAILVIGVAALLLPPSDPGRVDLERLWAFGIPAAMIVLAAVSLEMAGPWPANRLAHLLGDASYSLYLVHGIVLSAFTTVWIKVGLADLPTTIGMPLFALAATLTATLGGVLTWRFFERPVDRALRRRRTNAQVEGTRQA